MSGVNGRGTTTSSSSSSALVDAIVSGSDVGGILCNDPSGLCVATVNNNDSTTKALTPQDAGVYTNLVTLAAKLGQGEAAQQQPLITVETADRAILVKDYAGYAVAVQIPKKSSTDTSEEAKS